MPRGDTEVVLGLVLTLVFGLGGLGWAEPNLLDERVENLKRGGVDGEQVVALARSVEVPKQAEVLAAADVAAYKQALREARAGQKSALQVAPKVKDDVLVGVVKAELLSSAKYRASAGELNGWLREYRDLPQAREVYRLAEAKRERPRQVCKTVKVKQKDKKGKIRTVRERNCKTVGKLGPAPLVPLAVEQRDERAAIREAARERELAKLSAEGRQVLGQAWRLRVRGDYAGALRVLLAPGARAEAGNVNWQGELVKIADFYHGKREWRQLLRATEPALSVRGPQRDEALWLAGFAHYKLGDKREAAELWQKLVAEEPVGGNHYARAAWWAARVLREQGRTAQADEMLRAATKDGLSFYGQLAAARLGNLMPLSGAEQGIPALNEGDVAGLLKIEGVRRGLALAQLGETDLAQQELRAVDDDVPYGATRTLAALGLGLKLPGTALQAGKDLAQRGEMLPAVLYPVPEHFPAGWKPADGWNFDRALMLGIMRQESAFQPAVGSWAGAQGLMQLMPATAAYVARNNGLSKPARADLHHPGTNLRIAQKYLHYLSGELDGNLMLVVAAYNGGIGNVRKWLRNGTTPSDDPVMWVESIPFDETRDYVEKVFANYWIYQQRLGQKAWSLQALSEGYWPLNWQASRKGHALEG
ncbi:MAG: hypothetical protein EBQ80_01680 [Proteobacteria bacterium]|nr:hypothetical protein [Pseudomonadota bacterium]